MSALKLLVVDDEPDIRLELQDFVDELGFECLLAANGQEALSIFKSDRDIHIVLSDLTMPGMTGLELLERIVRDDDTKSRIRRFVFMTGNGDTRAVIEAMRLGASEFMLKPMDLDLLEDILIESREYVLSERFRQLNEQAREAQLAANEVEIDALNRDIRRAYAESLACLARAAEYKDHPPQRRQFFIEPNKFIEVVTPLLDAFAQHRRIVDGWNDGVDTQPLLPILNRCCFYESLRRSLGTGIRRQSG